MDRIHTNASDRRKTMTVPAPRRVASVAAAVVALVLAACGQQAAKGAESRTARAAKASLTGQPGCSGPGVHDVHVALFRCDTCHPTGASFGFDRPYTFPSGATSTAGGSLTRDASGLSCNVACHFPKRASGPSVAWSTPGPLACTSCHEAGALPAEHPPVAANASRADCQGCHLLGGHMAGAVAVAGHDPQWMTTGASGFHAASANAGLAECRGCHGPQLGGSLGPSCGSCHDTGLPSGVASWKVNCVMCHGGIDVPNGAPPKATWGNAGDPVRIGAHTQHVTASAIAPAAPCSACHPSPADVFTAGHLDGGTAEVTFARSAAGTTAGWDRSAGACASTYCHAGVAGGSRPAPVWTRLGEGEAACGACHGLPPPAPHPSASGGLAGCVSCHGLTMRAPGEVIPPAEGGKHLDGAVEATGGHPASFKDPASPDFHAYHANRGLSSCQGCHGQALDGVGGSTAVSCSSTACHGTGFTSRCTACHGGAANQTGAPPRTTWGQAGDPTRAGGHTKHVTAGAIAGPVTCAVCHVVPADALSAGHVDGGTAEVTFSGLARAGNANPSWSRSGATCATTYCHGGYQGTFTYYVYDWGADALVEVTVPYAGSGGTPSWTGGPVTCASCHGAPPPNGNWHEPSHGGPGEAVCSLCHPGVNDAGTGFTDPSRHVDGILDVTPRWVSGCFNCH